MVVIIDYGMGNVSSVEKALNFLNIKNIISNDKNIIKNSSAILLPGVGSFSQGMNNLRELNLVDLLTDEVVNKKKPFLGICLGMQLIFEKGSEPRECDGLGWIKGEVKKLDLDGLKIPHMGWNDIEVQNNEFYSKINNFDFYFIHSYHVLPTFKSEIAATVNYGIDIVASIHKDNIFATQFHPEKSQQSGLCLLKEFFETIC
ncbi:imidazole glycerol phosphate synthase subunit HisH [Flavobacteriaceae bacterium]|nr:imidazole glycerol phosphate synthase subunit HisH [Flavobacteriaceae bacterium]